MLMSELLAALQGEGVTARPWHIRHLLAAGTIESPRRDATGRFQFSAGDLKAIRAHLASRYAAESHRATQRRPREGR